MAGEWEVVEQPTSSEVNSEVGTTPESSKGRGIEEPLGSEDARSFGLGEKVAPSVTNDLDGNLIPIKLKPRRRGR